MKKEHVINAFLQYNEQRYEAFRWMGNMENVKNEGWSNVQKYDV